MSQPDLTSRTANLRLIALSYGLLAGGFGNLDPFFKGVGQNYGGYPGFLPSNNVGTAFFIASSLVGILAFVITQIGFARKVRANLLELAFNAAYIALPVVWRTFLLPGYQLSWLTVVGLALIIGRVVLMHRRAGS